MQLLNLLVPSTKRTGVRGLLWHIIPSRCSQSGLPAAAGDPLDALYWDQQLVSSPTDAAREAVCQSPYLLEAARLINFGHRSAQRRSARTTWADIIEGIILSCSDQQLFTSGAYALCLRYSQGCSVSVYHYNIVSSSLLVTCATHLMSVTIVSKYWKHKLVACFRVLLTIALYMVTAVLLANTNTDDEIAWPVNPPDKNIPGRQDYETPLVPQAACFQKDKGAIFDITRQTFGRNGKNLARVLGTSIPKNNKVPGWNFFLLLVLWYAFAIVAEALRFFLHFSSVRRGVHHATDLVPQGRIRRIFSPSNKYLGGIFWFYQFVGACFCTVTIVITGLYVTKLRGWMNQSGWIEKNQNTNPEYDPTTFGQLVPLLLVLLTVFTFLQLIGGKWLQRSAFWQSPAHHSHDLAMRGEHANTLTQINLQGIPNPKPRTRILNIPRSELLLISLARGPEGATSVLPTLTITAPLLLVLLAKIKAPLSKRLQSQLFQSRPRYKDSIRCRLARAPISCKRKQHLWLRRSLRYNESIRCL